MNDIISRIQTMLSEGSSQASAKLGEILPEAVTAIVIIVAGWIIATVLMVITKRILDFFAVDKLVGKTPLQKILRNVGIHKSITEIIGLLIFWMGILFTLVFASEALHLQQISDALAAVTGYIPQVIAALLIVVVGMLLARFLQMLSEQSISRTGVTCEHAVGKVVYTVVMVFVILAAIEQLGLDLSFITTNVVIVLAVVLLVAGIGGRPYLENFISCYMLRSRLKVGDMIEIDGVSGEIKCVSLTDIVIETDKGEAVIPATLFTKHTTFKRSSDGPAE